MQPAYADNKWSAIFFIVYLAVELYLFMNLVMFYFSVEVILRYMFKFDLCCLLILIISYFTISLQV